MHISHCKKVMKMCMLWPFKNCQMSTKHIWGHKLKKWMNWPKFTNYTSVTSKHCQKNVTVFIFHKFLMHLEQEWVIDYVDVHRCTVFQCQDPFFVSMNKIIMQQCSRLLDNMIVFTMHYIWCHFPLPKTRYSMITCIFLDYYNHYLTIAINKVRNLPWLCLPITEPFARFLTSILAHSPHGYRKWTEMFCNDITPSQTSHRYILKCT